MNECPKCHNTQFNKEGLCCYCVWKGDVGPGAELKNMIRKRNEKERKS